MRYAALSATLLCLAFGACTPDGSRGEAPDAPVVLVLAASDLRYALPEIVERHRRGGGDEVRAVFGSTGQLAAQIEQGAPADLFLAADEAFIDRLHGRGLLLADTRRVYAVGRLAVVWSAAAPPVGRLADLRGASYGTIAIPNPEHAPYGRAARDALAAAGLWVDLQPRLVFADNVLHAHQLVSTGNSDAAIGALPVARAIPGAGYLPVDAGLHPPLRQTGAVLHDAPDPEGARAFLDFLGQPEARAILVRFGFEPPEP